MQHRMIDQAQLQTDVPVSSAGSDDEQISTGRGIQERLSCRALNHVAAHRHVRIPLLGAAQGVGEHLGRRATAPRLGLAEREVHGRTAALPVLDSDNDAPEPSVPVLHPAAHDDDRAVGTGRHGQADRAEEQPGETSEPSGPEYQSEGVASLADQPGRRVLGQHLTRQPYRRSIPESGAAGGVVVGLKLHSPCDNLLEFAFTTAAARGVPLRAVHGRAIPIHAYTPWGVDHTVTQEIIQDAQKHLSQALHPWCEKFPGVAVTDDIRLESPARVVVAAAERAELLIVGRRIHHAPAPRLGSVAQAAVHHARRPVAVIPHE